MDLENLIQAVADSLFVELEASGRHVHVTKEQSMALFGHLLTPKRPLSQPGQFLAQERVTVIGPKGEFRDVAVLGPERSEGQVEISLTDARTLGIDAPIRLSGDIQGTPGAELAGTRGRVRLLRGVIAAKRHIHLTPRAAERFGVKNGETVKLKTLTERPVTFEDVSVRVSEKFAPYAHLDYDEANACGFKKGDLGENHQMLRALLIGREPGADLGFSYTAEPPYDAVVIGSLSLGQLLRFRDERVLEAIAQGKQVLLYTPGLPEAPRSRPLAGSLSSAQRELKNWGVLFTDGGRKRLITAQEAKLMRQRGQVPGFGAVLTPLAKEILEGND